MLCTVQYVQCSVYFVLQDVTEEKDRDLSASRQKLSSLESDSQKRIAELENQLTQALSAASGE